jgi:hypothetical protein
LRTVFVAAVAAAVVAAPCAASAQGFGDSFESSVINPFWSLTQQNGTIGLSSDQHHSGSQSVKLTGSGGGQVNVWLSHVFPQSTTGRLSVWFYDTATTGIYAGLYAFDSTNPATNPGFSVDVADWNPSTYVWYGPGMVATATSVTRTLGWHKLELQISAAGFSALIDNVVVGSVPGAFTFNEVRLLVSGPGETGTFYFDDFNLIPPSGAICDIELNKSAYSNGDTVVAPVLRFANLSSSSVATEIKVWLGIPSTAPISVINVGANGQILLPPGTDVNAGPLTLFPVTPALPRGAYEFSCRILNPTTGEALATDLNPFTIE